MTTHPFQRRHGFRFSLVDALILLAAMALTLWLRSQDHEFWWIVPVAIGHFFLFCNVFLVWRNLELIWAGAFVLNVFLHVAQGNLTWWPACLWQLPITFLVIFLQMRSPWYHGIGATRLNPRLQDYLEDRL